jgi:REP element-mobilizing transposase RayT
MGRPPREDFPGAWHHVYHRGARREPIFANDSHCFLLLEIVGEAVDEYGIEVHAYSLMPNHYHFLIRSVEGNLSDAMQYIGGCYTRRLNAIHQWDGPVFKGRFRNQLITNEAYLWYLVAYIHLNPVRAHLVGRPDEECWTSHRAFLGLDDRPSWLTVETVLAMFGSPETLHEGVMALHRGEDSWPTALDLETGNLDPGLVESTAKNVLQKPPSRFLPLAQAAKLVCEVTGTTLEDLRRRERGPGANSARRFAVWALNRTTTLNQSEIGDFLEMSTTQVAKLLSRLRRSQQPPPLDQWMAAWRERTPPRPSEL